MFENSVVRPRYLEAEVPQRKATTRGAIQRHKPVFFGTTAAAPGLSNSILATKHLAFAL